MRTEISPAILKAFPDIEDVLWNAAVISKYEDPDIKLMGLHVRVKKCRHARHWSGWANPIEDSRYYNKKLIHPAGRIDLTVGILVPETDLVRLMAHELRHIGQFHRGRKIKGYLTTEWMPDEDVEPDCYEFEKCILTKYQRTCGITASAFSTPTRCERPDLDGQESLHQDSQTSSRADGNTADTRRNQLVHSR